MSTPPRPRVPRRLTGLGAALVAVTALLAGCFGGSPSPSAAGSGASAPATSSAAAATPSASASASAAGPGGKLVQGAYAQVMVDGLRVRISAKPTATAVGALFFGDVVRIRSTAGTAGGYTWYEIETFQTANDQPLTGYVAGAKGATAYLKALAGKPTPTPSRSPTPSPVPSGSAAAS